MKNTEDIRTEITGLYAELRSIHSKSNFFCGIPEEFKQEMEKWETISKSPYSDSYYNTNKKSWSFTPENALRVSDHWNFESMGEIHCKTNVTVSHPSWTLASYQDGIWNVVENLPFSKEYFRTREIRKEIVVYEDMIKDKNSELSVLPFPIGYVLKCGTVTNSDKNKTFYTNLKGKKRMMCTKVARKMYAKTNS